MDARVLASALRHLDTRESRGVPVEPAVDSVLAALAYVNVQAGRNQTVCTAQLRRYDGPAQGSRHAPSCPVSAMKVLSRSEA